MGYTRRKLEQLKMLYGKRLKKPIANVLMLMEKGFYNDDFIHEFHRCYAYLWDDIQSECNFYRRKDKTFRGKKPLVFPSPYGFILTKAHHALVKKRKADAEYLGKEQIDELRAQLIADCRTKMEERRKKKDNNTRLLQDVVPNYASNMIGSYFYLRKFHREKVNERYYVLNEIAMFNNKSFVGFFFRVMGIDSNNSCREFALQTLQKWDKTVHLPKKRKGKRDSYANVVPVLPSSPKEVVELMNLLQMERDKSYNVFISHRSIDETLIINIKNKLNNQGLSVYVDWMIDREGLPLDKFDERLTWEVILTRLMNSNCLFYAHTKNCIGNKNIEKELTFSKEHNIPMAVLNFDDVEETDEIKRMPHAKFVDSQFVVETNNGKMTFTKWLKVKQV